MGAQLTIVARIEAIPDGIGLVETDLRILIEPTLVEAGCLRYDLHQDNDDPAVFLFYENRESRELWQAHMHSPHVAACARAIAGAVASFSLSEMTRLSLPGVPDAG